MGTQRLLKLANGVVHLYLQPIQALARNVEEKKMVHVINETVQIKESVKRIKIREFYKKKPKILGLSIAITVVSLLGGWFLSGLIGLGIGIILAVLSFILPPRVTKVREIERDSS
jgi:hypothetical protein